MLKILIVDDDRGQLELFSTVFKLKGFSVETASSGEECFSQLRKNRPDLILLDIVLVKESGLDVLRQIRKDQNLDGVKVMIITNLSKPGLYEETLAAGANDFVLKAEVTPGQLVDRVKNLAESFE